MFWDKFRWCSRHTADASTQAQSPVAPFAHGAPFTQFCPTWRFDLILNGSRLKKHIAIMIFPYNPIYCNCVCHQPFPAYRGPTLGGWWPGSNRPFLSVPPGAEGPKVSGVLADLDWGILWNSIWFFQKRAIKRAFYPMLSYDQSYFLSDFGNSGERNRGEFPQTSQIPPKNRWRHHEDNPGGTSLQNLWEVYSESAGNFR